MRKKKFYFEKNLTFKQKFKQKFNFIAHQGIHSEEKPFKCHVCFFASEIKVL